MRPPSQPVRTCVGCRQEAGKGDLVRLVRDPATGAVLVDMEGRRPGRGAYLHLSGECVAAARRRGAVGRALRAAVPASVWETLESAGFPGNRSFDGGGQGPFPRNRPEGAGPRG